MKLEQFEKDDLKSLTEHRWFKVLEKLVKDMETSLLKEFKFANLADVWVWTKLNWVQNKLAWAEYLINMAHSNTKVLKKIEVK